MGGNAVGIDIEGTRERKSHFRLPVEVTPDRRENPRALDRDIEDRAGTGIKRISRQGIEIAAIKSDQLDAALILEQGVVEAVVADTPQTTSGKRYPREPLSPRSNGCPASLVF